MLDLLLKALTIVLVVPVVVGAFPITAIRVLARMYPKDHPRRAELIAEVHVVPRKERIFWVGEQLSLAASEGSAERAHAWRVRRREEKLTEERTKKRPVAKNLYINWSVEDRDEVQSVEVEIGQAMETSTSGNTGTAPAAATLRGTGWLGRPHDVSQTDPVFRSGPDTLFVSRWRSTRCDRET